MSNSDGKQFRWRDRFIFTFEVRGVHSGETSKCWRKLWPCLKRKCSNRNSVKHQLMNNTHRPCRVDYMHVYIWSWFIYHERTIKCSSNHCITTCLSTYVFAYLRTANSESLGRGYCSRLSQRMFSRCGKRHSDSITEVQTKIQGLTKIHKNKEGMLNVKLKVFLICWTFYWKQPILPD